MTGPGPLAGRGLGALAVLGLVLAGGRGLARGWARAGPTGSDPALPLIMDALRGGRPGQYVLQAAIAALHARAPTFEQTDWPQIVTLYDHLLAVWPSPVTALNRTVALAQLHGAAQALLEIGRLEHGGRLAGYRYLPAIKADLLCRLGRSVEAASAYRQALDLTANETEREFLTRRLTELSLSEH